MLQPVVRRTWGLEGQTPLLHQSDKRDRISVASFLTISPNRKRLGLYFQLFEDNINGPTVLQFIRSLKRHIRGKIILILDNFPVHHSTLIHQYFTQYKDSIQVEWLPGYAPQLNPVEQVWSYTKYSDLHNWAPHHVRELHDGVVDSLKRTRGQQRLLRSFFKKPRLAI